MDILQRDIPLGEIVTKNIQSVYALVNVTEETKRGTLLSSSDGGATFGVATEESEDVNGVLMDTISQSQKATVLVTGTINANNIAGLTDSIRAKLFSNKIIVK